LSPFFLEEAFNQAESFFSKNLSGACFKPLSLWDLVNFYSNKEEILGDLLRLKLDYSTQYGLEELRNLLAEHYLSSPEKFLITSGASEAIFLLFSTLKFKKILVQRPIYQSLFQIAKDSGAKILNWFYEIQSDFDENFERFKDLISENPDTEAIVINNPNNPLGIVLLEEQLYKILGFLYSSLYKNPSIPYLIFDEVFRDASLISARSIKDIVSDFDSEYGSRFAAKTIVISDLSKSYSLQGLRIGWIHSSDPFLLASFSSTKNYLSLRNSILSEKLAVYALKKAAEIISRNQFLLRDSIEKFFEIYLSASFEKSFELLIPIEKIATPYAFVRLKDPGIIDKLASKGVFLLNGEVFDEIYKDFSRINFKDFISV
jgi:aspartate/methionine/tyrosine aminotransferase